MGNSKFYSEKDIANIISKREVCSVEVYEIRATDKDVMIYMDGSWSKYRQDEIGEIIFPGENIESIEFDDGGLIITK